MKHLRPLLFLILVITLSACNDDDKLPQAGGGNTSIDKENLNKNPTKTTSDWARLEFPRVKDDGNSIIVVHTVENFGINYALEWDCDKRSQRWTCYQMYEGNSGKAWNRNNWQYSNNEWSNYNHNVLHYSSYDPFQPDPMLDEAVRTELQQYRDAHGNYNRGHIVASADRLNSEEANEQTFYLSNIMPQFGNFNGGIWQDMESKLRTWNTRNFRRTLYVCKGGTIDGTLVKGYTNTGLLVPKYFFMAVLCEDNSGNYKALAFWVEHIDRNDSGEDLSKYAISIDELERKTGIDFFCNLPDGTENSVEKSVSLSAWEL